MNGANIATPAGCSGLPTSLAKGAAVQYCTFTQSATAATVGSLNDFTVGITANTTAAGLPDGTTNGAGVIKVVPRPRLAVNVWASPYRLGGTGNGLAGVASYSNGNITLSMDPASADTTLKNPTGWLYVSVQNQGGSASNLAVNLTRNGSAVSLASCSFPSSLATSGSAGDTAFCIVPVNFTATGAYTFLGTATATNSVSVAGTQPSVIATLNTCSGGQKVVPNLVDTLSPAADGTSKTVSQAQTLWGAGGFTPANLTTSPAGALGSKTVTTQSLSAYSCKAATSSATVTAP